VDEAEDSEIDDLERKKESPCNNRYDHCVSLLSQLPMGELATLYTGWDTKGTAPNFNTNDLMNAVGGHRLFQADGTDSGLAAFLREDAYTVFVQFVGWKIFYFLQLKQSEEISMLLLFKPNLLHGKGCNLVDTLSCWSIVFFKNMKKGFLDFVLQF
jgi:hypothetical protein